MSGEIKATDEVTEFFGEAISVYPSAEPEQDEILISVSHPLINQVINYITRTVFTKCIEPFAVNGIWERHAKSKQQYEHILLIRLLMDVLKAIVKKKPDYMYEVEVRDWKLWVVLNETGKYTVMFPEDY